MLILASASPRRHELLLAAGILHEVRATAVPEHRHEGESGLAFARRMAEEKARAICPEAGDIILGADTIVCLDEEVFGKPADEDDARRMLGLLSGRDHWVHTGICLLSAQSKVIDVASTRVTLVRLSHEEIEDYLRTGEPWDKAGAYAIQGRASKFVSSLKGCYSNVVGLPISLVYAHLKTLPNSTYGSSTT